MKIQHVAIYFVSAEKGKLLSSKIQLKLQLLIFLLIICLKAGGAFGQGKMGFELAGYAGKLLDISSEFPEVRTNFQIDFAAILTNRKHKYWHSVYNFPLIHVRGVVANYGNNEILGSSFTVLPEIHYNKDLGNSYFFNYHVGYGISYFTKPYDAIKNPDNLVIGSPIVATPAAGIGLGKKINNFTYSILFNYRHSSNGHFSVPNIGTNVPLIGIGIQCVPKMNTTDTISTLSRVNLNKRIRFSIGGGYGVHEVEGTLFPTGGPKYRVIYGRIEASKRISYKSSLHIGFTCNTSEAAKYMIINESLFDGTIGLNHVKVIGYFGHEFHLGHLGIYLDLGLNVYDPFRKELIRRQFLVSKFFDTHFSNEIGFNYYLTDPVENRNLNFVANLSLRTIWGKADFFNTGLKVLF